MYRKSKLDETTLIELSAIARLAQTCGWMPKSAAGSGWEFECTAGTHGWKPRAAQVVERAGRDGNEHGVKADRPDEVDKNCTTRRQGKRGGCR